MFQNVYHKYSTNSLDYMNSTQVSKLTGRTNREKTKWTTPSQDSFVLLAILFVCLFVCLFVLRSHRGTSQTPATDVPLFSRIRPVSSYYSHETWENFPIHNRISIIKMVGENIKLRTY